MYSHAQPVRTAAGGVMPLPDTHSDKRCNNLQTKATNTCNTGQNFA